MLEAKAVSKRFGGVLANDRVDLSVAPGEVVALVGENGAGKSTLVRILCGLLRPDSGSLAVDARPTLLRSPRHAAALRIAAVHQHFSLVPSLTVLENLWLSLGGRCADAEKRIRAAAAEFGLEAPLGEPVRRLPVPVQQRAEILRALAQEPRYLILDEPTAALGPADAEAIRHLARNLADRGRGVVFVTHKIADVAACADRVTVLRRGRVGGEWPVAGADLARVCAAMVGELGDFAPPPDLPRPGDEEVLALVEVSVPGGRGSEGLYGLSLALRRGEILGVGGVSGSGQEALAEVAAGMRRPAAGSVRLLGRDVTALGPADRQRLGLAHVPADRRRHGAAGGLPVYRNLCLRRSGEPELSPGGLLRRGRWRSFAQSLRDQASAEWRLDQDARHLSGGNLQRLILARELEAGSAVLVAVYPTRGLDSASAARVRRELLERRRAGGAVLLVSEDLDELLELSDRVAVLSGGRVTGVLERGQASPQRLGLLFAGGSPLPPGGGNACEPSQLP